MNTKIVRMFVITKVLERLGGAWSFGTYILFLQSINLSLWEANLLNTMFMTMSAILDPFTGNWGDRIGQKKIYLIGMVAWATGHFVYGFAGSFWFCALAELTSAIGKAFQSEAMESWLRNQINSEETHGAITRASRFAEMATIPTAIAGGLIGARFGLSWPWFLAGFTGLTASFVVWWMLKSYPEKPLDHVATETDLNLWQIAKGAWREPLLRRSFVAVALVFATYQPFNMFWPVVFKEASGRSDWLGGVWIGIAVMSAIGGYVASRLKVNSKTMALVIASVGIPMLLPMWKQDQWWLMVLSPFLVHEIGRSAWGPMLWTYTNKIIPDHSRTSINSLRSSASTIGAAAGLLISGALTRWLSPTQVWGVSAVTLILVSLWVWRWNHSD